MQCIFLFEGLVPGGRGEAPLRIFGTFLGPEMLARHHKCGTAHSCGTGLALETRPGLPKGGPGSPENSLVSLEPEKRCSKAPPGGPSRPEGAAGRPNGLPLKGHFGDARAGLLGTELARAVPYENISIYYATTAKLTTTRSPRIVTTRN